jgi:hypothetical protein
VAPMTAKGHANDAYLMSIFPTEKMATQQIITARTLCTFNSYERFLGRVLQVKTCVTLSVRVACHACNSRRDWLRC